MPNPNPAMSYFTAAEKQRLQFEWPDISDTLGYDNVTQTQLSIARFSGGAAINGKHFVYFPAQDELWRDDVLALVHGWRRTAATKNALPTQIQEGLF